jgi:hypothetical protein
MVSPLYAAVTAEREREGEKKRERERETLRSVAKYSEWGTGSLVNFFEIREQRESALVTVEERKETLSHQTQSTLIAATNSLHQSVAIANCCHLKDRTSAKKKKIRVLSSSSSFSWQQQQQQGWPR